MNPLARYLLTGCALAGLLTFGLPRAWAALNAQKAESIRAGMQAAQLRVEPPDATEPRLLTVKVADDPRERYTGYQFLAFEGHAPIWFVFPRPQAEAWHMHNVRYPLDIAYVDARGRVIGIERMQPGASGYRPAAPIEAALEAPVGRFEELGIRPGTRLRLERPQDARE